MGIEIEQTTLTFTPCEDGVKGCPGNGNHDVWLHEKEEENRIFHSMCDVTSPCGPECND